MEIDTVEVDRLIEELNTMTTEVISQGRAAEPVGVMALALAEERLYETARRLFGVEPLAVKEPRQGC
jgi:hypothetical protein